MQMSPKIPWSFHQCPPGCACSCKGTQEAITEAATRPGTPRATFSSSLSSTTTTPSPASPPPHLQQGLRVRDLVRHRQAATATAAAAATWCCPVGSSPRDPTLKGKEHIFARLQHTQKKSRLSRPKKLFKPQHAEAVISLLLIRLCFLITVSRVQMLMISPLVFAWH